MIRAILAEDHTLVRTGLRSLLAALPDVDVVGDASDGLEALALIRSQKPDVAIIDISMPGMNGIDLTRQLAAEGLDCRVLILSAHDSEEYVLQSLRAGAKGYLLKGADLDEFAMAVRAVAGGGSFLSPNVSRQVIEQYLQRVAFGGEVTTGPLTSRQRQVLQLIAEGATTKQVAARLGLSIKTVETHRANLMERLGIHDVQGLVRYAIREGLTPAP